MITQELRALKQWGPHHRQLVARLLLVLIATVVVDAVGTVLIWMTERNVRNGDIHGFFDAFFFSTVQLLTVSSQIRNPLTTSGRVVDIFMEIWAVIVVAGSAGAVANFFQNVQRPS